MGVWVLSWLVTVVINSWQQQVVGSSRLGPGLLALHYGWTINKG